MEGEGDLDVKYSEWSSSIDSAFVSEDVAKLHFISYRDVSYSHPRTTMLMFGPKNAPATQRQYLYVPNERKDGNNNKIHTLRPARFLVLTVTQFAGIPMCDVFKVLQYWSFEEEEGVHHTVVKVGLSLHFIKTSMFKAQIIGGTKDELTDQALKWLHYAEKQTRQSTSTTTALFMDNTSCTSAGDDGIQVRGAAATASSSSFYSGTTIAAHHHHPHTLSSLIVLRDKACGDNIPLTNIGIEGSKVSITKQQQRSSSALISSVLQYLSDHAVVANIFLILLCACIVLSLLLWQQQLFSAKLTDQLDELKATIALNQQTLKQIHDVMLNLEISNK